MVRFLMHILAFATTLMVGCTGESADSKIPESARAALEKADQFELLSIDPDRQQKKPKDDFHGARFTSARMRSRGRKVCFDRQDEWCEPHGLQAGLPKGMDCPFMGGLGDEEMVALPSPACVRRSKWL